MINRLRASKTAQGALILVALLLIFFSTPLSHLADGIYSPADLGQIYAPLNLDVSYWPANTLPFDVLQMIHPWLLLSHDQVQHGQVPLWNPFNGNGVPLLANFQAGVFSIFTLPHYMLPFNLAALLAALLKLFSVGFLTFLYLKQIGLGQLAALFGGSAFMFAGHNVVWLAWPNTGVGVALVGGLYFLERLLVADSENARLFIGSLVGLCLSLTIGLLAGNPETFYFCALPLPIYFVFRVVLILRQSGNSPQTRRRLIRVASGCVLAVLIAAGLAGAQLVPFFEYLTHSAALLRRKESWQLALQFQFWPLSIFPDVLGNPGQRASLNLIGLIDPARINYNEVNSLYVGGTTLFLAVIGVLCRLRQVIYYRFFGIVAILWLLFAMNIFNVRALLNVIPGMSLAPYTRSVPIWLFAVSCCAAFSVDALTNKLSERRESWQRIVALTIGLFMLIVGAIGAYQLIAGQSGSLIAQLPVTAAQVESHVAVLVTHLNVLTLLFGAALVVIALLWLSQSQRTRHWSGAALIVIVFLETGYLLKDQNPTIPRSLFYPETAAIQQLRTLSQDAPLLVTGSNLFTANLNIPYQLSLVSSYDALDIRYYDELSTALFGAPGPSHSIARFDERGLQLFSIATVVTNDTAFYTDAATTAALTRQAEQHFYNVYHYDHAVPRFHVVYQAISASDDQQALEQVQRSDFNPSNTVVLIDPAASAVHFSGLRSLSLGLESQVVLNSETSTTLQLTAAADQSGYLVLAKTFYPGWKARVNGVEQPVLRANYAFSAIPLPKGENRVEFYYDPDSFKIGAAISLSSTILGVLLIALYLRRR